MKLITLENSFRVQIITEFLFENLPQLIIQSSNNNITKWSSISNFSFAMIIFVFIKDVALLTLFSIRKFIDNSSNPELRPKSISLVFSRINRETAMNIKSYLMDPVINGIDKEGNCSMHQLTKFEQLQDLEDQISSSPHLLFLLNKNGLTPLDVAINSKDDEKAKLMIDRMNKLNANCSLKFI